MGKKVLLVEDNEKLSLALKLRLDAMGYCPLVAGTVAAAMSLMVTRKPELSMIDINLPDGNGFALARHIRNNPNTPKIPMIFISASRNPEYREQATLYSSTPLLEKPFNSERLIEFLALAEHGSQCMQ